MDNCTPSTMMSPPKKRSSDLGHLSSNEKQCILNMYKQQLRDEPDKKINMVVFEISKTLGIEIMEVVERVSTKRKASCEDAVSVKRPKKLAAKEFRKCINNSSPTAVQKAILDFSQTLSENDGDCIALEYLESGGNCTELLQTLEKIPDASPIQIFNIVSGILQAINKNYPQYNAVSYKTCKYILNTFVPLMNKMIGLSSSAKERKAVLRLLTEMVTSSSDFAKDVLLTVNFSLINIELLTKNTSDKDSVREHFIHFLTAFLIEEQFAALSILLEKRGLLTSIVSGLKYDVSDNVCSVLLAMKNYILESDSVSKTSKMKVFNTQIINDIVNLYNWKGPAGIQADRKKTTVTVVVDEYEKSKVNEAVHSFLLVLCTSHKYGVIFKDHNLGLGKDRQNKLIHTVLESLERPWEHSYAKELVIKICAACPDLTKTVWNHLKEHLTPRQSPKWLSAINFAKQLVEELQPSCVEFCIKEFNVHQICQVLMQLIVPHSILKALITEARFYEQPWPVRHSILLFLKNALNMLNSHINICKKLLTSNNSRYVQKHFQDYLTRNLPTISEILEKWSLVNDNKGAEISCTSLEYLETAFEVFECYKILSPKILENFSMEDFDTQEFIHQIKRCTSDSNKHKRLQISAINIFFDINPSSFTVETKLFQDAVNITLEYYYENPSVNVANIFRKILKNTSIFESSENEIDSWLNGVFHLNEFSQSVPEFLVCIVRLTNGNMAHYLNILSHLEGNIQHYKDVSSVIESLCATSLSTCKFIKHSKLSPLLPATIEYLNKNSVEKPVKVFVQSVLLDIYHSQTSPAIIEQVIAECNIISESVTSYVNNWAQGISVVLKKSKCRLNILQTFSESFLNDGVYIVLQDNENIFKEYPHLILNLVHMSVFYFCNLLNSNNLNDRHFKNINNLMDYLLEHNMMNTKFYEIILSNPVIATNFSILNINKQDSKSLTTKLVMHVLKISNHTKNSHQAAIDFYQNKVIKAIHSIIKKPQKYAEFQLPSEVLELFHFYTKDCYDILISISLSIESLYKENVPIIYFHLINHAFMWLCRSLEKDSFTNQLPTDTFQILIAYVENLTVENKINSSQLTKNLLQFLKLSPGFIEFISETYFINLLAINEYNEDNMRFITYILNSDQKFVEIVKSNIESIVKKKGLFLNLLSELVLKKDDDLLDEFYKNFEPSILKSLNKPQKAGPHFKTHYIALGVFIEKCMPKETYKNYIEKVQKFEVSEVFHAYLLTKIFKKALVHGVTEKQYQNMFLTLAHLNINVFRRDIKSESNDVKLNSFGQISKEFLEELLKHFEEQDLSQICQNESFKQFCTMCLEFGLSKCGVYLEVLQNIIVLYKQHLHENEARWIINTIMSSSEVFDIISSNLGDRKRSLLYLWLKLFENWPQLLSRKHLSVLLSTYQATIGEEDRVILQMLKMSEMNAQQTSFYDFKPLLWGKAASIQYSVQHDIQKSIWKQPKISDVLDILQEHIVLKSIKYHPLTDRLQLPNITEEFSDDLSTKDTYDLAFFLPLFAEILLPEYVVPTYKFAKSGALSLTIIALSNDDSDMRAAACHVLHRLYTHIEAKTTGKDLPLWLRFIEVICKGVSVFEDLKLNNFVSIYLARMSLILTQPNHVMYVPLSYYLSAKVDMDFNTIPELYTFMFSNNINHEHHRRFILEILCDGCRTDKDVAVFMKSMAYKLILEMYSSSQICDNESKSLIKRIMDRVTRTKMGQQILCENHSWLAFEKNSALYFKNN